MTTVLIDEDVFRRIEADLGKIEFFRRSGAMRTAMLDVGNVVKKQTKDKLPMADYPGDKAGLKPLRDTLTTKVVEYEGGKTVVMVGYAYPAGAHGHLVEEGHTMKPHKSKAPRRKTPSKSKVGRKNYSTVGMGGRVLGFHWLELADAETRVQQRSALEAGIKKSLPKSGGP